MALVPYEAEKEFAFPCFHILMVHSLKAYSILGRIGCAVPCKFVATEPTSLRLSMACSMACLATLWSTKSRIR